MQDSRKLDLSQLEDVINDMDSGNNGIVETKENILSNSMTDDHKQPELDSGTALQVFLDRIPISHIPGIKNSPVVELEVEDNVIDAIRLLYEKDVSGAPIADIADPDTTTGRFPDRYVGFIDFARLVLWSLEKCKEDSMPTGGTSEDADGKRNFFDMLKQNPQIAQTKVGQLAKSFLWDPIFPVHMDDTLFRVLLLLSKHRLHVLPVIERTNFRAIGFLTQDAVVQTLLQSSGLEWFDSIADKALSKFRFESEEHLILLNENQSLEDALHSLRKSQIGAIAVVSQETQKVNGCIRNTDVYLLFKNEELFNDMKNITAKDFIQVKTDNKASDPTIERNLGALFSSGILRLSYSFLPRMDSPVTAKRSNTLKEAMTILAESKGSLSFIVDDSHKPVGVLTLRDIIVQFAPPCVDSNFHGNGFFESALEQAGCSVKNGTIICEN